MKNMKIVDIAVAVAFIIALIVIYFFWGCKWDPIVTIIAVAIIVIFGIVAVKQHKKIDKLESDDEQK